MDIGITHPTIDTYINQSSSEATRGSAANIYAKAKDKFANKIINDKGLDIEFRAITFTTYGEFGTSYLFRTKLYVPLYSTNTGLLSLLVLSSARLVLVSTDIVPVRTFVDLL